MQTEHVNLSTTEHDITQEYIDSMESYIKSMPEYIAAEREYVAKLAEDLDTMRGEHLYSRAELDADIAEVKANAEATSRFSREDVIEQRCDALYDYYAREGSTKYHIDEAIKNTAATLEQLAICEDWLLVLTDKLALFKSLIAQQADIQSALAIPETAKTDSTL